jgi:hypothetical protein
MVSKLALFCLATVLATFEKIGQFFPNHLVTLNQTKTGPKKQQIDSRVNRMGDFFADLATFGDSL